MPGPVVKVHKLDTANIASRLPEPLRKPSGIALELLSRLVGADDPTNIMQVGGPLISIYKNAAGVPDKAIRAKATQEFLESARRFVTEVPGRATRNISEAAEWLATKYPRVAAHTRITEGFIDPARNPNAINFGAQIHTPPYIVNYPMKIEFSKLGGILSDNPDKAREMLAHEATHAAQALGNKYNAVLYKDASNLRGYMENPFEQMARARGEVAEAGMYGPAVFRQKVLNPKVQKFIEDVFNDRKHKSFSQIPSTASDLRMAGHGWSSDTALNRNIQNILDNLAVTYEDRSLINSTINNMRFGGPGYIKERGHQIFRKNVPPLAPDIDRGATATRLLEDMIRQPDREYGSSKQDSVQRIRRILLSRMKK